MESIHSNEINLTCHICGRCFRSDVAIRKHLLVHSGIKPFECELCGKTFSRNDKLKEHRNCHFGIKRYSCEFCEKCYTQRFNLVIHTRQEHVSTKYSLCYWLFRTTEKDFFPLTFSDSRKTISMRNMQ